MDATDPTDLLGQYADVPVTLEARLDQRSFPIRKLMEMQPGSVLRMSRNLGENIEILVDGTLLGFVDAVVSDNSVGIRITKWKTPAK
jgi:flagellar motor switch protein FliN/FliY